MFSRQTVLAVLAASAALMSADAFAPAARPIALSVSFTCLTQAWYQFEPSKQLLQAGKHRNRSGGKERVLSWRRPSIWHGGQQIYLSTFVSDALDCKRTYGYNKAHVHLYSAEQTDNMHLTREKTNALPTNCLNILCRAHTLDSSPIRMEYKLFRPKHIFAFHRSLTYIFLICLTTTVPNIRNEAHRRWPCHR